MNEQKKKKKRNLKKERKKTLFTRKYPFIYNTDMCEFLNSIGVLKSIAKCFLMKKYHKFYC